MKIIDRSPIQGREITKEGYLKAYATVTCVGIQEYLGQEIQEFVDEELDLERMYRVFRPPSMVFSNDTKKSLKLKPITMDHPSADVDSENYSELSVGTTGDNIINIDDLRLAINILLTDTDAVEHVGDGRCELSSGYECDKMRVEKGSYKGQPYDVVFDSPMEFNHIAIVPKGRCGNGATILDSLRNTIDRGKAMGLKLKRNRKVKGKIKDINMDALVTGLVDKLMPDMQKLISTDDFMNRLSQHVAKIVSGGMDDEYDNDKMEDQDEDDLDKDEVLAQEVEEDEDILDEDMDEDKDILDEDNDRMDDEDDRIDDEDDETTVEEKTIEDEDEGNSKIKDRLRRNMVKSKRKAINDAVRDRVDTIDLARRLKSNVKISNRSNKQILKDALSPMVDESLKNKSLSFMKGIASMIVKKRDSGRSYIQTINDSSVEDSSTIVVDDFLDLKKAVKTTEGVK